MAKFIVEFAFTNRKGEFKKVRFPMDKRSYKAYHDPSVSPEWTQRMMLIEYREFCDEMRYQKKIAPFPVDEHGREIDIPDPDSIDWEERMQARLDEKFEKSMMNEILQRLPRKQREAFCKVHLEGIRPTDAAKMMGIKKCTLSINLSKAEKTIEEILGEKNF